MAQAMLRPVVALAVVLFSQGCRPPSDPRPAESPAVDSSPATRSEEPAPLPPEETPPPVQPAPPPTNDARPVEPGITATGAPTRGRLPKAVIDDRLKAAQPGILACYEAGLKAQPDLRGAVNVDLVVSTEGKVVHATAATGDGALPDETTVRCILAELEELEFPPPAGGRVFIHYPLQLEPPKR
jgi:hypothetical protein